MKIVYFYQYFCTPQGSWGTRVYEFAKEWVKAGHDVTIVSSIYSKSDLKSKKFIDDQFFEGIHVKVLNIEIDNKHSPLKRVWSFLLYSIVSSYFALTLAADVVVASSGPITVGIPGLIARYVRGRKLVFETRDLWPDGAIELGMIKSSWLKRLSYWFEKRCYIASSYIITLSPGMTQNIKSRFRITRINDVTNAANVDLFANAIPLVSANLQPKSYAIYTGNIGMVNNSYWLHHAAKILKAKNRQDVVIVLIGDGKQKQELVELSIREGVNNIVYLNLMPKIELVPYIQNAFASLVPLRGTPVLDTSSPNKFFESMVAGIPVIQNTKGWMKDFLIEHNVGFTVDPESPEQLANKLIWMKDNPEAVAAMGSNASLIGKRLFSKNHLAEKMLKILKEVHESG